MSLINQMLRDLENRRRRESNVLTGIRAVDATRESIRAGYGVAFLTLLGVMIVGGWWYWHTSETRGAATTAVTPINTSPVAGKSAATAESPAKPTANSGTSAAVHTATQSAPLPVVVAATTPVPKTVTASPSDVPAATPVAQPAPTATDGAHLVGAEPVNDAGKEGVQLDFDTPVSWKLSRLSAPTRVVLDIPGVAALNDVIRALPLPPTVTNVRYDLKPDHSLRLVFGVATDTQVAVKPDTSTTSSTLRIMFQPAPVDTTPVADTNGRVVKSPVVLSPAERSRNAYQQGQLALGRGDADGAAKAFESSLAANPDNAAARETLAMLYIRTGRSARAEQLLSEGIASQPAERARFAKLYASLLNQRGATAQAVQVLQNNKPDILADPDYYALLAALLQRKGDNQQAATLYRHLLSINPGQGVWWMGLGISLEQLGQPDAALAAYQRARDADGLNDNVAQYVQNRINALKH